MIKNIEHQFSKEGIEETKAIYAELGMEYEESYGEFSDVSFGGWYYPYIYSAQSCGYISGYEDNTFRPEKEVTEIEFLSMLERALGYTNMIEAEGGYPDGVISVANRLKLIDNPSEVPAARARAAIMLYNALHSHIVTIEGYVFNENGSVESQFGNTVTLLELRNVYKLHGTIKPSSVLPEKTVVFIPDEDFADFALEMNKGKEYIFTKAYSDIPTGEYDVYINASDYENAVITAVKK